MPTINNVHLAIGQADDSRFRRVTVTYQVCFSACEALAQSTFVERVALRGADWPDPDDPLITLRNACLRAQRGCIDRTVSATVPTRTLDEDDGFLFSTDEIYARVSLRPFVPGAASVDSNEVTGQFG